MNINNWTVVEWGALGNWVLAFATFIAAIVALWTSKQTRKPKVIISLSYGYFIGGGNMETVQHLVINAVNGGMVPVTLNSTSFRLPNKKHIVFIRQQQDAIPKKLQPSESTEYYVESSLVAKKLLQEGYSGSIKLFVTFTDSLGNIYKYRMKFNIEGSL